MKQINIMTSSDNCLARCIFPQVASIGAHLNSYNVSFYLVHNKISQENVDALREYAESFENISFADIIVKDTALYETMAKHGGSNRFPPEAYFYFGAHEYLPGDIDRVMYIDAGDVIINGDISDYYFDDFENKSIIATPETFALCTSGAPRPFELSDLDDPRHLNRIRMNCINSGCIVINLNSFREKNDRLINGYLHHIEKMCNMPPLNYTGAAYLCDQGLLAVSFFGDIKLFGLAEGLKTVETTAYSGDSYPATFNLYRPFNFAQWMHNAATPIRYAPIIIHYIGSPKPWHFKYSYDDILNPESVAINEKQIQLHQFWWDYCSMTPVYDELCKSAASADAVGSEAVNHDTNLAGA